MKWIIHPEVKSEASRSNSVGNWRVALQRQLLILGPRSKAGFTGPSRDTLPQTAVTQDVGVIVAPI